MKRDMLDNVVIADKLMECNVWRMRPQTCAFAE